VCEALEAPGEISAESGIFSRMAAQGQTMIAAAGDDGAEDCYDTNTSTQLAIDDPGSQPDVISAGGTTLTGGNVGSQTVWNHCQGELSVTGCAAASVDSNGAGGGGYSDTWARPGWQPAVAGSTGTNACGKGSCRSVPDISGSANPDHGVTAYFAGLGGWTTFGGTSAVAPTDAGLFADTNQGCTTSLGMVGPTLYAANSGADFTDITSGNNDFTGTNGGLFGAGAGYDAASGLGTPVDQNLAIALQGGSGCPSIASLSAGTGPTSGGPAITINGGSLGNATAVDFGPAGPGQILSESATSLTVVPPSVSTAACVNVTVINPQGVSATSAVDHFGFGGDTDCAGSGYRFVAADGGIFDFGSAQFKGSTGGQVLNKPIVGMATTPSGNGYWLVASDGGIFSFGDAAFYGSTGALHLNKPIVGMAATPNGNGYWLVASDGGIFAFGDAKFFGSTGALHLNKPIVGMAATPNGNGYWLVASDGGIFSFGNANFFGSTGGLVLNKPIVGMASTSSGNGYWLVASDGGIFTFGSANFFGSTGALALNKPIVGLAPSTDSGGYWLVASDGGIFAFGDAAFYGSSGATHLNQSIVGMGAV
jgi:ribosomal protein L24E